MDGDRSSLNFEDRTQSIGRELLAETRDGGADESWLDRLLMRQVTRDERVKASLFRLVDVLPALRDGSAVASHLKEYLSGLEERILPIGGRILRWMPVRGAGSGVIADLARLAATRMARRFIAASDLPGAVETVQRLRSENLAFTIDLLGEAVLSEVEAERYQSAYLELIGGLARSRQDWPANAAVDDDPLATGEVGSGGLGSMPAVNVSVKLSSLYSQFDPLDPAGTSEAVRRRLRPILRLARDLGVFVNVDMEQFAFKNATLQIFQEVFAEDEFRDWPHVGIAIQAYLVSSGDDLRALNEWSDRRQTPIWVRLVKGAYWDYETVVAAQNGWPVPVFTDKAATDASFERLTDYLFDNHRRLRPAIASHNVRSVAHALAAEERAGLHAGSFEFHMLYGMADPLKRALVRRGHRVRVYTPFGQLLPGMAYLVRRLLENTSNESFLQASLDDRQSDAELLRPPAEHSSPVVSHQVSGPSEWEEVMTVANTDRRASTGSRGSRSITPGFHNEPVTDFSDAASRSAMAAAVINARRAIGRTCPAVVGGKRLPIAQTFPSINPSDRSEIVGHIAATTAEQASAAVDTAAASFDSWRDTPPADRIALLLKLAQVLRRRRFEFAAIEVLETGKPWREADADVAEAIDFCRFYAAEALRLHEPSRRDVPGEDNATFYEPRGVTVVIAPWNFPLAILCGMTAAALAAGNTVVFKPAEQSSVVASRLMDAIEEAGFPPGVANYLPGIGETVGPVLVRHPATAVIAFTGSRAVGLQIQRQAAEGAEGQEHIKKVITELGGKNAVIVDADADLDEAVHGVVASAFGYGGQKCSACSRVIALDSVYDAFVARLVEATRSLRIGAADDPGTFVGPVIDDEARQRIEATIARGRREARLLYQATIDERLRPGCFVPPTIFGDVPPGSTLAQEEIFGPVLAALRAADLGDALRIANGTKYALTGGLFSRSPRNIERVRREFRVGNLYINRKITGALVDRQPFGGFKLSGVGSKAGGSDYLQQFMQPRTITENTLRRGFAPAVE